MKSEIKIRNLIANSTIGLFNPSKFDRFFFLSNKIFKEDDFQDQTSFSSQAVQIVTSEISLVITTTQIVVNAQRPETNGALIQNVMSKMVEKEALNIANMGINFCWFVPCSDESQQRGLTKKLFFNEQNSLFKEFDVNSAAYGVYLSKDFDKTRMKLDVKPISYQDIIDRVMKWVINFDFNFHKDFEANDKKDVLEHLSNYSKFEKATSELMKNYYA